VLDIQQKRKTNGVIAFYYDLKYKYRQQNKLKFYLLERIPNGQKWKRITYFSNKTNNIGEDKSVIK